nr:retrovirus-related Pol polyprotein from transposon TNT 1-94 [Tanacetum cinerariifolium]
MLFPLVPDTELVLYSLHDKLTSRDKSLGLSAFKLSRLFFSLLSLGSLVVGDRKGKYVDAKFDKPSVVRQPNAQRIPKPSVLGKPAPFSNSLERIYFPKTKSVPKANVSEGLSKPVTAQTLPQTVKQAVSNTNVLKPRMYRIDNRSTQTRAPQLPRTVRNTNPRVSTSTRVNNKPNDSRLQLKSNQLRDKVMPNNSQVKVKKTQVEVHSRIPSVFNKMKSVTACKDSLNSRTLNANVVCATCNKCLVDYNHIACVTKMLNDVNARTKKPNVVPISTRNPKSQANKSVATSHKKKVASKSTKQKPQSYFRVLYENTSKACKWWIERQSPSGYKWVPKTKKQWVPKLKMQWVPKAKNDQVQKELYNSSYSLLTMDAQSICNFVEKFLGSVCFGNDQFAPILGYGDLVQENVTINRVYYIEGFNHNLFLVGQFCDADLEVAFRKSTCYVRDLQGRLNLLHMDLCGPMRVASINGKKYILVIIDDYSRYTWTLFLLSKDETPEVLKDFLTMIQRNLQARVITVRTDRGTKFLNKTLNAFFKEEGIKHQTSTTRTPEQNGIVKRQNRTLVEAARTMLSASQLLSFFWAKAIATACYTQNRSIIIPTHDKTLYHIINERKPSIKHLYIFIYVCYITRDGENLDKMKEKGDQCILVGYSTQSKGYHVYNKRTRMIVESIHLHFDEIKEVSKNLLLITLQASFLNDRRRSNPQDKQPSTNIQSTSAPSTPTNDHAEENNNDQAEEHCKEVKRIFRYLRGTVNMGLWYPKGSSFELTSFSDVDHAGCIDSRKITSGGIQFLGDKLVSWMSKKQNCTAMSLAEAEYVALSVENGIIELYFVRTEYQLADMFTKALPEDRFKYLVRRIGMRCLTPAELEVLAKESA